MYALKQRFWFFNYTTYRKQWTVLQEAEDGIDTEGIPETPRTEVGEGKKPPKE